MIRTWICLGRKTVYMAGDEHGEHCAGKKFAVFDPNLHTELVTGFANSWIDVARHIETHWKDHPLYNEV